jgi:citrate lyase beta subunit
MQVEGGEQIQTLEQHMAYFGAPAHTAIGAMIETPKGVLNVNEVSDVLQPRAISEATLPLVFFCQRVRCNRWIATQIAASNERLTMVVMGTSDLTTDLRARHTRTREPMLARYSGMSDIVEAAPFPEGFLKCKQDGVP